MHKINVKVHRTLDFWLDYKYIKNLLITVILNYKLSVLLNGNMPATKNDYVSWDSLKTVKVQS